VPVNVDDKAITTGVDATLELIRAMVQSGRLDKLQKRTIMDTIASSDASFLTEEASVES